MTPLQQRMSEDIQFRGLSERTQEASGRAVRQLAEHSHTSPARITEEELRDSFFSLKNGKHYSRRASTIALCGITCFYAHTLQRDWTTLTFVRPPQEHTLPVMLSLEDVHTILQRVRLPRSRACLRTISACGLRLQEGTPLQIRDSASARMVVHVRWAQAPKTALCPGPSRPSRHSVHTGQPTAIRCGSCRRQAGAGPAWRRPPRLCRATVCTTPCGLPSQPVGSRSGRRATRCGTALPPLCWTLACTCASSKRIGGTMHPPRRPA